MIEVIFLICLGLIWIIFATIQDLKMKEVANWLNFSLILFALGFRFFYSLFENDFHFFYQGIIGLAIFFIAGNLFYYSRIFAGGDAKLLMALGAVLPFSYSFNLNLNLFLIFLFLVLFVGSFYTLFASLIIGLRNFKKIKKEIKESFSYKKVLVILISLLGFLIFLCGFLEETFFYIGILVFILPYLYIYAKSVDETCMVKKINTKDLVEGDWLYQEVKIGKNKIKPNWNGLNKVQIKEIQKYHDFVKIKYGVAFVPSFLVSYLIYIFIYFLKPNILEIF